MKALKTNQKTTKSSFGNIKKEKKISDKDVSKASNKIKKSTSLRLEKKTLKALKIIAIENDTSLQQLIETMIKAYVEEYNSTR